MHFCILNYLLIFDSKKYSLKILKLVDSLDFIFNVVKNSQNNSIVPE
jgi:hypothetical protein